MLKLGEAVSPRGMSERPTVYYAAGECMPPVAQAFERPAVVRVGDWVVYPRLCRATKAGTPVHLRAQVIDLLVVLARRPNGILSKEDVAAALWPGVHVSSSALTRCMAELRQVFEDDAKNPWLIETIAKRGYRLIAPVTVEEDDELRPTTAVRDIAADPDALGSASRALTLGPDPEADQTALGWPAIRRWMPAAAVALAAAGAIGWIAWRGHTPLSAVTGRETVVLADVANTTGDKSFDGAVRLALAVQLEQAPKLRIISDARVRETLALMQRPASEPVVGPVALEVCRREGAVVVLAGTVSRLGKRFAVGLEAIGCKQGEPVARVIQETDGADGVLAAVGSVASAVRAKLGESQASLTANDVPVARATTASLDALQALSLGDARRDNGRLFEALDHYRQATTLDPQFAVAWARLGGILKAVGHSADASDAFTRAYSLAGRTSVPERYYITAHYHLQVTGQVDDAVEALRSWKRLYAGAGVASVLLAGLYANDFGLYQEALEELRAAEVQLPAGASAALLKAVSLAALGRSAEARRALADPRFRQDLDGTASAIRAALAWSSGDRAGAEAEMNRAVADDSVLAYYLRATAAEIAFCEGRYDDGRRLFSRAAAIARALDDPAEAARTRLRLAMALAVGGYRDEAMREVTGGLADRKDRDTWLRAAGVASVAGDEAAATRFLAAAARETTADIHTDAVWFPTVSASVLANSKPDEALRLLAGVAPRERGLLYMLMPLAVKARALERAGRHAEAIEACRSFNHWRGVDPTSTQWPAVQVTLARALAASGDLAASRAAYETFLTAWNRADAGVPLLVAARSEYAKLST